MNRSVNQLSDIVDNGLCIGCGLCQSIAGKDKIKISMTSKGRLEPKEISKISPEIFKKIVNVCPGTIVEGLPKEEVNQSAKHNLVWGYYLSLCYTWSTDKKIRFESSTGGLLNGLSIYLLETKKVKFILHTAADPKKPMRSVPKFSYSKEELLNCEGQSRYGPTAPLEKFHEALDLSQPFVFVGKPCDISAIRQLSKIDTRVNQLCKYLLTLVCGGFAEFTKAQEFIESFNVKEDELSIFRYRGYGNPGKMYIKTKDGREYDREYNSFWGEESTWRVPFRCKICPDAIGESADIAALDTWRGGSPKGEDEGFNAAIVRTKKGLDLLNEAAKTGFIHIGDKLEIEDISDFQPHQVNKKKAVYARHQGMKKNNSPTINTKGLRIEELSKLNSVEFNQKEEDGITSRIKKIK
uniref:Putative coenzyme F420 hydrogenase/dehydrogenase, beta subunit C-terminal domain n=1 Tax=uncultured marine microorganism HF4000_008G09 TaxID=455513 RepID=B3T163_9ZZZZ|nr:putative coenzyme F420 hydrogenase/dehydrogenase, beta subunit C-terminal domain [uncultured marine microorganism HF4000_008G09]